ncbi:hypothetical protein JQC92_15025 [Shewanella sp. 202IG2-18]|uniref:hypothetical protein n=1 Tax=Parashewanella hymeniacidonis TaxID=2807618 RepID=UPI00195FE3D6|nr:hypothetical protein [Parashewanella hymeniacidonis]MBM7073326.1 hypothetical protein [Parashewanella hymeniacidonis]
MTISNSRLLTFITARVPLFCDASITFKGVSPFIPKVNTGLVNGYLQTTHARLEISRIKYKISKPTEAVCGCYWFKQPELTQVGLVYGTLYIHRQKVAEKEAAHVAIPIGETLKKIIDRSRDNLVSDYVVHRLPKQSRDKLSKDVKHVTQLHPDYISRQFSKFRDKVGCCNHLKPEQRPTFHEIRALAAFTFIPMIPEDACFRTFSAPIL